MRDESRREPATILVLDQAISKMSRPITKMPALSRTVRPQIRIRSHKHTGHNHIGHNYMSHNYIGHNYIGHNHIGHDYTGHNCIGHNYIGYHSAFGAGCAAHAERNAHAHGRWLGARACMGDACCVGVLPHAADAARCPSQDVGCIVMA